MDQIQPAKVRYMMPWTCLGAILLQIRQQTPGPSEIANLAGMLLLETGIMTAWATAENPLRYQQFLPAQNLLFSIQN
jgi:hypothetical protein